ncbi:hypothetical protein [Peribacillus alkalitolerans]|uniref:hypothetical protein n=1 Tax=Peribacillus alkalitolerans TaxID=1550385 RepID=UPI0013D38447|nr:hypothetical protein [Peribacillus alkalitolerans]
MKNLVIGGIGILSSTLLFGMTLISAAVYSLYSSEEGGIGRSSNFGQFGTALYNIGFIPLLLSIIFFFIGIYYFHKSIKE